MNLKYQNLWYLLVTLIVWMVAPLEISAQGGYALDLDGGDDYVEVSYDAALNPANFTIEAWAKVEGGDGTFRSVMTSRKITNTAGYMIYAASDNQWQFWTGNNTAAGWNQQNSGVAVSNEWTHIACSFDGTNKRIYINGELAISSIESYTQNTSAPLRIGAGATESTPNFYFPGKIDEVRVWSDVRSQAEIQANMHKELVGNEANLVAYYQMSDGSGTTLTDNSTNSNTGTLTNSPTWKTSGSMAGPGMSLEFDGTDDFVLMGSCPAYSTNLTYEAWIKLAANPFVDQIIGFDGTGTEALVEFRIYLNKLELLSRTTGALVESVTGTSDLTDNVWHHVAFVKEGTTASLYVDGIQEATKTFSLSPSLAYMAIGDLHVNGAPSTVSDYDFGGQIEEVRIWSSARSEAELRANMFRSLEGTETGLEAYYRFDQQNDAGNTTLYDITGNGYDGTLTNMDAATDWVSSDPFNTWIGSEDGDWSNGENWSSGSAPTSTQGVGIYSWNAATNSPASANISARNFHVASGASLSHSGNLTVSDQYYNAGTFTTTGNVIFSGSAAQTIRGTGTSTFGTLTVNNSAGVTMAQNVTATSGLTLTDGILNLNSNTLTLGNGATVSGTPGASNHVNATSGNLTKGYSGTGSFQFPVGDGTLYTPITLNFTSGTFSSGNATVNLTTGKHPNNNSPTDYLNRYWTVNSSGISSFNCAVSANYNDADIRGTEADIDGAKWDGSSWSVFGDVTAGSNLVTGTVSSFSDFTGGQPGTFPVEWLDFTATPQNGIVLLDWTTGSEINSDYFSIERSADQNQWRSLGEIGAAGYSNAVKTYRYKDQDPLLGKSYYRLKQVDLDGSFDFSPVVEVSFDDEVVLIYPNPVQDMLIVDLKENQKMKAQLMDIQGRVVLRSNLDEGKNSLPMRDLSPGIYTLQLKDGKGKRREFQVVKE